MFQPQVFLPDGTVVKYCHTPEPLYATEDGEHIYFILPAIGVFRELPQRFLKPAPRSVNYGRKQTYKVVTAPKNTYLVHLLVASAWHGPRPDILSLHPQSPSSRSAIVSPRRKKKPAFECHHLNGITTDNRASNLIWLSHSEHRRFDAALKKGLILTRVDPAQQMEYEMTHHMEE